MLTYDTTLPTNTLEAVNISLRYMREPPVDDLALINTSYAAETAYATLQLQNRTVQSRGWFFNTWSKSYTPDGNGEIVFDTNVINVTQVREDFDPDIGVLMLRSNKLFKVRDRTASATIFTQPVNLTVTEVLPFDMIPETFRIRIALEAASMCGAAMDEPVALSEFHQRALLTAQAECMDSELDHSAVNFLSNIPRPR